MLIEDREVEQRAALWFEQIREAHEGARLLPAAAEIGARRRSPNTSFFPRRNGKRCCAGRSRSRRAQPEEPVTLFATERNPASAYRAFIGEQREAGRRVVLAAAENAT